MSCQKDIAFSEKSCGHILKENLYTWVGAVAHMFYTYHISKFEKKKTVLTKKIREYGNKIISHKDELQTELCELVLTSFAVRNQRIIKTSVGGVSLRLSGDEQVGTDTIYRLLPDPSTPSSSPISESAAEHSTTTTMQYAEEHVSKKRKLVSTNPSTLTCRACRQRNDITCTSCMYCKAVLPGSLVQETAHFVAQPDQAPAAPNHYQYNQRSSYAYYANQHSQPVRTSHDQHLSLSTNANNNYNMSPAQSVQTRAAPVSTKYQPNQRSASAYYSDQQSQQKDLKDQHHSLSRNENDNQMSIDSRPESRSLETAAHYESLCSQLTRKLEKVNAKSERRKKDYHEMVQKNAKLEEEVRELKEKNASLEKLLLHNQR